MIKINSNDLKLNFRGGSKTNRDILINGSHYLVKSNKLKASNKPEDKTTIHRQTVLAEYLGSKIAKDIAHNIEVQDVELLVDENNVLYVGCKDFCKPTEIVQSLSEYSSRDTLHEKQYVNDFTNYILPTLIPKIGDKNLEKDIIESYIVACLVDFIISNSDRHLGNIGYILDRDIGGRRVAPLYDFGASLGSQLRLCNNCNIKELIANPDSIAITKCMQRINGIRLNENNLINLIANSKNCVNIESIVETNYISETFNGYCREVSEYFDNQRLELSKEMVSFNISKLRKAYNRISRGGALPHP